MGSFFSKDLIEKEGNVGEKLDITRYEVWNWDKYKMIK